MANMAKIIITQQSEKFGEIIVEDTFVLKSIDDVLKRLKESLWRIATVIEKRKVGAGWGKQEKALLALIEENGLTIQFLPEKELD